MSDKEWFQIRSILFGDNEQEQNIHLALELAAKCTHPEAQWLMSKVGTYKPESKNDLALSCFYATTDLKVHMYRRAILQLYCLPLQNVDFNQCTTAWMLTRTIPHASNEIMLMAANGGEPDAMLYVSGTFNNKEQQLFWVKRGYEMGHVRCGFRYGSLLPIDSKERCDVLCSLPTSWAKEYCKQILYQPFKSYLQWRAGRNLKRRGTIHGNYETLLEMFYSVNNNCTKEAVMTWSACALRLWLIKDIRVLIAKYIWKTRKEGLYLREGIANFIKKS